MSKHPFAVSKKPKNLQPKAVDPFLIKSLEARFLEGKAFENEKKFAEAEKIYREIAATAQRLHLNSAAILTALGYSILMQNRYEECEPLFKKALKHDANFLETHINLGALYRAQEKWKESKIHCKRALEIKPRDTKARLNLGVAEEKLQQYGAAVQSFLLVLSLDPENLDARKGLASTYVSLGETEVCIPMFRKVLEMDPDSWPSRSHMLFAMQYDPTTANEAVLEEHLQYQRDLRNYVGSPRERADFRNPPAAGRKLRIGYMSGDFRGHVVMKFVEDVLKHHDKNRFEVFCIGTSPQKDHVTERIRNTVHHWRDITKLDDEQAEQLILGDNLDILVDLSGHSGLHRLPLLARRLAPVQTTWCGYSGTTGVDTIDYIVVDNVLAPDGEICYFTEKPLRLPNAYVSFNPGKCPDVGPLPFERNGFVTFGCMNNPSKINKYVLGWWAEILKAVPNSRILMRYHLLGDPLVKERLARVFRNAGIPSERYDMDEGGQNFLIAYNEVDIALDTFPYNGTTTTCEALWMGLPVITIRGDRFVARVGASLLTNVGFSDLVAENPSEYIGKAVTLANNPERLAEIRRGARERLPLAPVFDSKQFTKDLEKAYFRIFEEWVREYGQTSNCDALEPVQVAG